MKKRSIKLFLRLALSVGFLSAVADRFGLWSEEVSAWGNWANFLDYTALLVPYLSNPFISLAGTIATAAEILFALCLLIGFKTRLMALGSGFLLLSFALSMVLFTGIKGVFDYSVFSAAAGAFALSLIDEKYMEIDLLLDK